MRVRRPPLVAVLLAFTTLSAAPDDVAPLCAPGAEPVTFSRTFASSDARKACNSRGMAARLVLFTASSYYEITSDAAYAANPCRQPRR